MNAPAVLSDASGLAETVSRARALLDEGDVIAAKVLAAKAYDDAKASAALGERFGAAEKLTRKARQLQGDALLIETRAKIAIADEWDAAKKAGLVSTGGRPTEEKPVSDGNGFSSADLGLTRKEVFEARKLRDAEAGSPGIVARAIASRLAQGLSPTRANLRAAVGTASATKEERGNNLYETPPEAVHALLALESFAHVIWEPACGRGAISKLLEAAGHELLISDLVDYETANAHGEVQVAGDFLQTFRGKDGIRGPWLGAMCCGGLDGPVDGEPDIVTNPPYGEVLNGFVAHALREHRPRKMALLLSFNFFCGTDDPDREFALEDCPPARVHVFKRRLPMMHRDGWEGNKASSRMNTAWFVWERNEDGDYAGPTVINRVDWKDYVPSVCAHASAADASPLRGREAFASAGASPAGSDPDGAPDAEEASDTPVSPPRSRRKAAGVSAKGKS